ncbi:MAG TPA: MBL fold metallo-hydrolase [Solirubrobacteraceae bacterium]|nr:MBL fold metallo-hydrolase [Solirubrobacteraceae bacterium]
MSSDDPRPIDVRHLGRDRVICAWLVDDVVVDPGPSSSLDALFAGLGSIRPRALALTHIHLDHAGGAGAIVRRWPDVEVWVHERGARHIVDPSRLVASATRLYGDQMDRLWGEIVPVPAENLRILAGGETLGPFAVAYTPGHASHHVSYFHEPTGRAFVGDVCGVRIPPSDFVLPPTPPPDIDLEAWRASLDAIEAWQPSSLALTHFGGVDDPAGHIATMRDALDRWGQRSRRLDEDAFVAQMASEIAAATDPVTATRYNGALPPGQSWQGLARYWSKHDDEPGPGAPAS